MIVAMLLAASAAPSAEAEALGRRLAATGTLATMLPMMAAKETDEIVAAHPELSAPDQAALRATAATVAADGRARIEAAMGRHYAAALSVGDLKTLVAFNESAVAVRYRQAVPMVVAKSMGELGPIDFKQDVAKAFCAESGKLCK